MFDLISNVISTTLGLEAEQLSLWQMALRATIVYLVGFVVVRLGGDRRFTGKQAAFDVVLSIIFGSTLSRAINGSAPFLQTIVAVLVLVAIHMLIAFVAYRYQRFDRLLKGEFRVLIEDGEVHKKALHQGYISKSELETALRTGAKITDPAEVKLALQERNGTISIIPKAKQPEIIEVDVKEGVQTVRIQLN